MKNQIAATAAVLAMAVAMAGCSADSEPRQTSSTAASTSEPAPAEADDETDPDVEAADKLSGERTDWHYGSSMVWNASGSYVVPGQPEMVVSVLKDFLGDEFSMEYAIAQVGDGSDASLAFVGVVSEDSADPLTPEEVVTYVGTLDPTTGEETSRHEVHRGTDYRLGVSADDGTQLVGSGSVVAFTLDSASATDRLSSVAIAFDVDKGVTAWQKESSSLVFLPLSRFALLREYADHELSMASTADCAKYSIVDLETGTPVVQADYLLSYTNYCTSPSIGGNSRFMTLEQMEGSTTVIDTITGTFADVTPGSDVQPWQEDNIMDNGAWLYDETSTLAAYGATESSYAGEPIKVVDMTNGEVVYEMPADTSAALSATIINVFDGDLYLSTTNGTVTLDLSTGETIDSGWEYVTVQRFDSGWTLDAGMNLHAPTDDEGEG